MKIDVVYGTEQGPRTITLKFEVDPITRMAHLAVTEEALQDIISLARECGLSLKVTE